MASLVWEKGPFYDKAAFTTDAPVAFLMENFSTFPQGARLFHDGRDVTPRDELGVEALDDLYGEFEVVVIPQAAQLTVMFIATVITSAVAYALRPSLPELPAEDAAGSPTNALGRPSNKVRLGERIPDIYGRMFTTPDFIATPFRRYENGYEVEYAYYCVGRGRFSGPDGPTDAIDLYDGGANILSIPGYAAKVYGPTAVSGGTAQQTIGNEFKPPDSMGWKEFDGAFIEKIPPHNNNLIESSTEGTSPIVSYLYPLDSGRVTANKGHIRSTADVADDNYTWDMGAQFPVGSTMYIQNAVRCAGDAYDYSVIEGRYRVIRSNRENVWLEIPTAKQAAWDAIPGDDSAGLAILQLYQECPDFTYTLKNVRRQAVINFACPRGLFYAGVPGYAVELDFDIGISWELVGGGDLLEDDVLFTITGSTRDAFGQSITLDAPDDELRNVIIVIRRTDPYRPGFPNTWSPSNGMDVSLMSAYADTLSDTDAEDIEATTILTRVVNNFATTEIRSRKLQAHIQRTESDGGSISTVRQVDAVLEHMVLDPRLGRLTSSSVDNTDWSAAASAITTYFGDSEPIHFDYLFDNLNTSFEDMVATLTARTFTQAYRQGDVIRLVADLPTDDRVLLFNHRNKIPGTETRTVRFGYENDYDGVVQKWHDPDNWDKASEHKEPNDAIIGPMTSRIVGIRDAEVARTHAARAWNRIKYVNTSVSFEATQEAALLIPGDIILVADGTRDGVQDGDVVEMLDTVTARLSQPVTLADMTSYVVWFQYRDGVVRSYPVTTAGPVTTSTITYGVGQPYVPTYSPDAYARATFLIVKATEADADAFRVLSVEPAQRMTYTVTAEKYDERVYEDDV